MTNDELTDMLRVVGETRVLAQAAPKGPWSFMPSGRTVIADATGCGFMRGWTTDEERWLRAGPFVVNARTTVPTLCGYVEALVREVRELRREKAERESVGEEVAAAFASVADDANEPHIRIMGPFNPDNESAVPIECERRCGFKTTTGVCAECAFAHREAYLRTDCAAMRRLLDSMPATDVANRGSLEERLAENEAELRSMGLEPWDTADAFTWLRCRVGSRSSR